MTTLNSSAAPLLRFVNAAVDATPSVPELIGEAVLDVERTSVEDVQGRGVRITDDAWAARDADARQIDRSLARTLASLPSNSRVAPGGDIQCAISNYPGQAVQVNVPPAGIVSDPLPVRVPYANAPVVMRQSDSRRVRRQRECGPSEIATVAWLCRLFMVVVPVE